ncbi:hypothetical protein SAMN02745121_00147 [Nannocystis exedens]|uniref:YceI-like domain-containing protein n=1 Tax=Nannocystis exedens TaxID=54 RepID=A0A1I1SN88_9BACT|nr:hypothetical protein [Nannocystis exedens]PCC75607.1 hypothetical protein NAEX_08719 [Nannocystis exedens]SFD47782.1 hypothetical protein SAMN02745121_00147 [Nannocystis exedens]
MPRRFPRALVLLVALASACGGGEPVKLAPKAEKLEVKPPPPAPTAVHLAIDGTNGKLGFDMEAPVEKIRGKVRASALGGEVWLDPSDLAKSRGLVRVELRDLELYQRTAPEAGKEFGEEVKNDTQNEHARQWLEISPDTPAEELAKNSVVEFALTRITDASVTDLSKVTGPEREVTFTASGDFLLHQRKAEKSVKLEATFRYDGDTLREVHVKSVEPLTIGLDEYDVRPRTGFSKLAAKTLEQLAPKVAKEAAVSLEFVARPDGKPAASGAPAPAPSPNPAGSTAAAPSPGAATPSTPAAEPAPAAAAK